MLKTIAAPADDRFQDSVRGETNVVWMPDGRHLLVLYMKLHADRAQIGMVDLPSGEFHAVTSDVSSYSQLAISADGRNLATVLTNVDSSVVFYTPKSAAPASATPLRIARYNIAWASKDRLIFTVPLIAIGRIERATADVQNFDIGEVDAGYAVAGCADGHRVS
jgi:hypothetical protein